MSRRLRIGVVLAVGAAVAALVGGASAHAEFSAEITAVPSGNGKITGPNGLNCGAGGNVCLVNVTSSPATLTATPSNGWTFDGWEDDCTAATTNVCTLNVQDGGHYTVTADFIVTRPVTITVTGNGTVFGTNGINCSSAGGANCTRNFANGDPVSLTASPGSGATFTGWTGCPTTPSGSFCSFTMGNNAVNVSAAFSGSGTTNFTLTGSVTGNGTITSSPSGMNCTSGGGSSCTPQFASGTIVTLTETPSSGATFSGWGGVCSGNATTCSVTMDAAKSVSATFTGGGSTFPLQVSTSGSGTVTGGGINCHSNTGTCTVNEPSGTSVTLAAVADSGFTFSGWTGACSGSSPFCTISMTALKTVGATFTSTSSQTATLTLNLIGKGTVNAPNGNCPSTGASASCTQQYTLGQSITLTAVPASGWTFSGWSGDCSGTGACSLTMSSARTATATFSNGGFSVRSLGSPLKRTTGSTCTATLRFHNTEAASARLNVVRNRGSSETILFSTPAGNNSFGVAGLSQGVYTFELTLTNAAGSSSTLRWTQFQCLPFRPPINRVGFVVTRGGVQLATSSNGVPIFYIHFHTNRAIAARMRETINGRLVSDFGFSPRAGNVTIGPFPIFQHGAYRITMTALDSSGRTRRLGWGFSL